MPLAPAATMLGRVAKEIGRVLEAHGVRDTVLRAEIDHMRSLRIAPTANRSVLGIMNEFTFLAGVWRDDLRPDLLGLAKRLANTPCSPLYQRHVNPDRELAALLQGVQTLSE
jgi:hypothetical protein